MSRKKQDVFTKFTSRTAAVLGHAWVFIAAIGILVVWALAGPFSKFSDTWQLIINTGTSLTTFLMVFIIQNTQNRDNMAINIKLDALLKASEIDETKLLGAEDESDKELEQKKHEEEAEGSRQA